MKSGIYKITVPRKGKSDLFYIGQSIDIGVREGSHGSYLRLGRHDNSRLQRAVDKYGVWNLEVICYAPAQQLDWIEQAFLDRYYHTPECMNLAMYCDHPLRGRKVHRSKEHSASIANWRKDKSPYVLWHHPEHGYRYAKQWQLLEEFPRLAKSNLNGVKQGHRRTTEGWSAPLVSYQNVLLSPEERSAITRAGKRAAAKQYHFYHPDHGTRLCGQADLIDEFPEMATSALKGLVKGKVGSSKGWKLK